MAGALAHGPQEAMGEVIQPVILGRRRSSDNIDGEVAAKEIKVTTDKVGANEIENPTNKIVRFSSGCTAVMRMRYTVVSGPIWTNFGLHKMSNVFLQNGFYA